MGFYSIFLKILKEMKGTVASSSATPHEQYDADAEDEEGADPDQEMSSEAEEEDSYPVIK